MGTLDPRALEALAFHLTTSTGQVRVLEGLVVMDLKATTTPLDLAQQHGAIPLLHLLLLSVLSLDMAEGSLGHLGSLLPSTQPMAQTLKAMVSVLKAMVSNSKAMDSSQCIDSRSIQLSSRCIHNPHTLVNPLLSPSRQLSQVFLNLPPQCDCLC